MTSSNLQLEKHVVESEEMKRMKNECINKLAYSVPTLCTAGFEQVIKKILLNFVVSMKLNCTEM